MGLVFVVICGKSWKRARVFALETIDKINDITRNIMYVDNICNSFFPTVL